ncbi:cytochrome c oxidase subunit II (plasmid) [Dinoroseobacter shibae DFL 12 = DSM 16493]|jgi:cytochrome c oxidase subunit 2|uniref:Cytochrome aa3 subunit 2 n=1 Tax=Dinoroseobacter shibae (strain DSM 16493 / NCIMB 14021 / DFL 12) TaxID=398580 RepID=A8LTQ3_DINSH|nr:cytochrome c oxidase subunit II [Dinoroseobacter shibae]ABV95620.1 cytochrome c oxidase subunit II [Dinoroseobacter shibae DFL 12 = DSM 16493]URF48828.1 cytochrome c oxidase subunit II [Dinoroseobacter shibae]URF53140.1 cytochrome c oxidase subunit II [Dinoroseobacter shibae]
MDEDLDILGGRSVRDIVGEAPDLDTSAEDAALESLGDRSALDIWNSQSALEPSGLGAAAAYDLTIGMVVGLGAVFVVVMAIAWFAWHSKRPAGHWWVWTGGVITPLIAISTVMVASTAALVATTRPAPDALVIEVTGYQFWWDVVYDPDGTPLRDANELILPEGRPVTLRLNSNDVIHSFWVPSISGKMDMIPGRTNTLTITATETGQFRGQCAEFCGLSHPKMAFEVTVLPPEAFDKWLATTRGAARDVARPAQAEGREVFLSAGCAACHEIRGVAEGGRLGPDLTRLGARASLGAGMWRMNQGNVAGWIADVQDMKPGAQMPSYNHLSGPDLRNLSAYLVSLQ